MSFDALGENFGALIKLVRRPIYLRSPFVTHSSATSRI